jgi:tetratricopeptide (TPR) repeat protein
VRARPLKPALRPLAVPLLAAFLAAAPAPPARAQPAEVRADDPSTVLDDPVFEALARRGIGYLYNAEFTDARATFDSLAAQYPGHPAASFLRALVPWWEILLDLSDTSRDEAFYDAMDEVVRQADRRLRHDEGDLDARFFKGAALAFRARLRANRRDYVRAAFDAKGATDYVLDVARRDPGNADFQFGRGVYDYYAATLREEHPRFRPLLTFFARGDRARGRRLLEYTFQRGTYLQAEAAYQIALLEYVHERDYEAALRYVTWLRHYYPRNPFFHTLEGRIHATFGHLDEGDAAFREVLARHGAGWSGYNAAAAEQAYYYLARSAMVRRDYAEALALLQRLQQVGQARPTASAFYVLGRLRQGMAHDARGERDAALQRYREVLDLPDRSGAHDRARQFIETPYQG